MRKAKRVPMWISGSLLAPCLALASCSSGARETSQPRQSLAEGLNHERVSLDQNYWGRLEFHWQINADGTGEIWRTPPHCVREGPQPEGCFVSRFKLTLAGEPLARFATSVNDLHQLTKDGVLCEKSITDQSYGEVAWVTHTTRQSYLFDFGCGSTAALKAERLIREATKVIDEHANVDADPYEIVTSDH